jgi:hypothetical protein
MNEVPKLWLTQNLDSHEHECNVIIRADIDVVTNINPISKIVKEQDHEIDLTDPIG